MRMAPKIEKISHFIDKMWTTLVPQEKEQAVTTATDDEKKLLAAVDAARREWEQARSYFDQVTDPDLIDYAIYEIEAAERKFMYLLRQAQQLGYALEMPPSLSNQAF